MIYTTNYARIKKLPNNIIPISIAAKCPNWYKGQEYKKLAPKIGFWKEWEKTKDSIYYIKEFKSQVLDKLNVNNVIIELLQKIGNDKGLDNLPNIALICYEPKPPEDMPYREIIKTEKYFCHRHLVSRWFNINGIYTKEF